MSDTDGKKPLGLGGGRSLPAQEVAHRRHAEEGQTSEREPVGAGGAKLAVGKKGLHLLIAEHRQAHGGISAPGLLT